MALIEPLPQSLNARIVCEDTLKYVRRLKDESMNLIMTFPLCNISEEYRNRLIADAVTGKLDVCHSTCEIASSRSNEAGNETIEAQSNPLIPDNMFGEGANVRQAG